MNHSRTHLYLLGAAAVAAVLVIAKVPFAGILPFAPLAGCVLMMLVMMKAMGGMNGMGGKDNRAAHGPEDAPNIDDTVAWPTDRPSGFVAGVSAATTDGFVACWASLAASR